MSEPEPSLTPLPPAERVSSPTEPTEPPAPPAASRDPACDRASGPRIVYTNVPEVRAALQGPWVLCSDTGLTQQPQDGLEVVDDRWHLLARDGEGVIRARLGPASEGAIVLVGSEDGHVQVSFAVDRGGAVVAEPIFTADPDALRMDDAGRSYRYVRPTVP